MLRKPALRILWPLTGQVLGFLPQFAAKQIEGGRTSCMYFKPLHADAKTLRRDQFFLQCFSIVNLVPLGAIVCAIT